MGFLLGVIVPGPSAGGLDVQPSSAVLAGVELQDQR